jgi:hypothetical protein
MRQTIATTLDARDIRRVAKVAKLDATTEAAILRKLILRGLPHLEKEVLGASQKPEIKKEGVTA